VALVALPGALTVYLSFNAGGFFAGTPAVVATFLAGVLAVRTVAARRPFEGASGPLAVAATALALFAIWTLLSASWSDAPGRALIEFDRALLYLLVLLLFGLTGRDERWLGWAVRGLALGIVAVSAASLITRLAPDVWEVAPNIQNDRLSYPLTYWNGLGMLAAVGFVLCVHLTCSVREARAIRLVGAAALPPLATVVLLTYSRGAILAGLIALVAYLVLGRPRAVVSGLVAGLPPTAVAVVTAYQAKLLSEANVPVERAADEGHDVAAVLIACMVAAALIRALLLRLDGRVPGLGLGRLSLPVRIAAGVAALAVAVAVFTAAGGAGYADRLYDRFLEGNAVSAESDATRERLTDPGNNGRLDHWRVALEAFADEPLHGDGGGTYRLIWEERRDTPYTVNEGHSLYLEALAEYGIVGALLLVVAIIAILAGAAARIRGAERALYAAVFAVSLGWALHAGVDWAWEMPAVTAWVFALGGMVLARPPGAREVRLRRPGFVWRLPVVLGLAALAVTPVLMAVSQLHLNDAAQAFRSYDCRPAVDSSLSSISALDVRPEPYELLGYCNAALGDPRLGAEALERAVDRDPNNWELHYALAVVRASGGLDPLPEIRRALRLNPHDPIARQAFEDPGLRGDSPRRWRREALHWPLPVAASRRLTLGGAAACSPRGGC
jgi:O-antigen ligase